jgi:hypothetical protein
MKKKNEKNEILLEQQRLSILESQASRDLWGRYTVSDEVAK